ncbi:MAG: hypothetical protein ABJU19_26160 [Roseobacter sp.]
MDSNVQKMDVANEGQDGFSSDKGERLVHREVVSTAKGFGLSFSRKVKEVVAVPFREEGACDDRK